ncbi:SusC/RagA family TonB-linked outer membrane protein [Dyadobacter psychrotolerans]|uniref:TonB-dependent receptor n=1 Tax=Dyadobacter psychrotolerans TaxID=2541721 RepID=A0A4R5DWL1_9BACT|nr:TonB-dependent receptor [Dyadobacter psychrotolerans]TDE18277.1 TonB-dependent receptor [Dyadobacter psychrotolerans]
MSQKYTISFTGLKTAFQLFLPGIIVFNPVPLLAENPSGSAVVETVMEYEKHSVTEWSGTARPKLRVSKEFSITGSVKDERGEALPGVNILVKGSSRGVTTDQNGNFTIQVDTDNQTLVFSFIGYQSQEVQIGGKTSVSVILKEDVSRLNEVLVVGYGTQSKAELIGSVAQLNAEKINNRTVPQLSQGLTGQLPGVNIRQTSGQPGSGGTQIQIRGVGSFGASTDPLILVDGIPTSSFNNINANDVESISVLKDASSAAIYGARAANGVILVTTKTGREGKLKVSYNGYVGVQKMTATPQFVNSARYAELMNEAIPNTYSEAQINSFRSGSDPDNFPNSNFVKAALKNSTIQTAHNATITNGSANSQYLLSFGYLHQDGIVVKNKFDRYNLRLNLTNDLKKNLKLTTRISGVQALDNQPAPPATLDFSDMLNTISNVVRFAPIYSIKQSNGDWGTGLTNKGTPVSYLASESFYKSRSTDLAANTRLDWTVTDGLILSALGGYTQLTERSTRFLASQKLTSTINLGPSSLTEVNSNNRYKTFQGFADYKKSIGNHSFGILAGYSFETFFEESLSLSRANLPSNAVTVINAGDANSQTTRGDAGEWALESYFGRAQYNFAHKYLLEGTVRYDGSSRFPSTQKYAVFPSIAVGWRLGEERFIKDNFTWLNELKLKASYGVLGNQNIGNYPYQNLLNTGYNYAFGNTIASGVARTTITDTTLHWESTRTKDIGIEVGLFKKLLSFSATYFDKYTYDILVSPSASVSNVLGFTVGQQNSGSLSNKGWEFTLEHRHRIGEFSYSVGANLTYLKNSILDLGVGNINQPNGLVGNVSTLFIGQPLNIYYGYETDGLFTNEADVTAWANQTAIAPNAKPGDIRYKDISGPEGVPDGKVDATYDRKVLGSTIPKINYGINLGANYKGFDLSILLQGVSGVSGYLNNYAGWAFYNQGNVQQWQADNHWTTNNPDRNAAYPRMEVITNQGTNNTLQSSFWVLNGSFLRLKAIQLGYTIPSVLTQKLKIDHVRLYANAENLHTWSQYRKGWDPEINSGGAYYPILANFTFGLNITF